ncbi:MAG: methyltransferase domain-containing protein [Elusimicrobia bacterium]|nr:methyltransferase domain-containing protein [Elusimicrobiota bacterium]
MSPRAGGSGRCVADMVRLVESGRAARVLTTACGLGVFDALARGPLPAVAVAERLGTDARAPGILLDALAGLGFARKRGGRYANSRVSGSFLRSGSPGGVLSNLRYQELLAPAWARLPEIVRTGVPPRSLRRLLAQDPEFSRDYILGMAEIARRPARELAGSLPLSGARDALDVGGGPGAFARALAEQQPGLRVTLLDLPPVLKLARRLLSGCASRRRIELKAGDYHKTPFGHEAFDLVLMSHITHDEGEAGNRRLVTRAFDALRPGGRLVIHDFMLSRDRTRPLYGALFSVHMLVYTRQGRAYGLDEYRRWMREAGFGSIRSFPVCAGLANATRAVVGSRP